MKKLEEVGKSGYGYVSHLEGRYIDVLKRTREYFKEPGIFRKRRWFNGEAYCTRRKKLEGEG